MARGPFARTVPGPARVGEWPLEDAPRAGEYLSFGDVTVASKTVNIIPDWRYRNVQMVQRPIPVPIS